MPTASRNTIGGDFALSALNGNCAPDNWLDRHIPQSGTWAVSGRAALSILLRDLAEKGVSHIQLPSFLCPSLLLPIIESGFDYSFYQVDSQLAAAPHPPDGAAVLLIHYFGWLNPSTEKLRTEAATGAFHLLEDFSHLFPGSQQGLWNTNSSIFFSARKFGPTPLGGWCSLQAPLAPEDTLVEALFWRSLAARLAKHIYLNDSSGAVEPALEASYLEPLAFVEKHLDTHLVVSQLPSLALALISGLDWPAVTESRRRNWLYIKNELNGHMDLLQMDLPDGTVPLGFVVKSRDRNRLRRRLAEHRIFCPVHWPLPQEVSRQEFTVAADLANHCLTVPIDQRYNETDLHRVIDILKGFA